jgi:uridine phosphorylase
MNDTPDPWVESFRETAVSWLLGPDPPRDRLPVAVLLPMENPDVYDPAWIADRAADGETCGTLTLAAVEGARIAFSSPKFGAPAVAMAVDVFAKAGFKAVVGVGFCGGLQSEVECGDLILAVSAARGDGASRCYAPPGYPATASSPALEAAVSSAQQNGIAVKTGLIVTTDGILRETRDKVEGWHNSGCLGVDMETAALYTVASVFGLDAIAILIASDNVWDRRQTDLPRLRQGWQAATTLALHTCAALSAESPAA